MELATDIVLPLHPVEESALVNQDAAANTANDLVEPVGLGVED